MNRPVEINAFVKAVNMLTTDEEQLMNIAVHLNREEGLRRWKFSLRGGRIVADSRPFDMLRDKKALLQSIFDTVDAGREKARDAAAYVTSKPWESLGFDLSADGTVVFRELKDG